MSNNKKILYLSYDGLTDPLGQSQILPYVKGLSKVGYEFCIISFEKQDRYKQSHKEIEDICDQSSIRWVPLVYHKTPPVLSTLFDIWKLWLSVKREYKSNPFQIIHCRSYITSLIGLRAKKKWGVKFIFDMRGFWADERVEGGLWKLSNPLYRSVYRFFKSKEKEFITGADHIISLTHNAKNEIESWKLNSASITVIPTCVDLDIFDPDKINKDDQIALRAKLGIKEDDFVLLYLGSWGTWYLTDEMLRFFEVLKRERINAKFLILSSDRIDLDGVANRDDFIITKASRNQVPLYVSIASLSVCFIKPSFSKKASSATKMGEVLAMKILVVTNSGWGDVDNLGFDNLYVLNSLKRDSIQSFVRQLRVFGSKDILLSKEFSLVEGVNSYQKVYQQVTD